MDLPVNDLDQLEKDPFDFFPKEDPFWNVSPEDAYNLIGFPVNNDITQYEVDNIGPTSYGLCSDHPDLQQHAPAKQEIHVRSTTEGCATYYPGLQGNNAGFNEPAISSRDFDPDQFLALCTLPQSQSQNGTVNVQQENYQAPPYATPINMQTKLFKQEMPNNNQTMVTQTVNAQPVEQIPYVQFKKEQQSPKNIDQVPHQSNDIVTTPNKVGCTVNFAPKDETGKQETAVPNVLQAVNAQNPNDVKALLNALVANSKVAQRVKTDIPPNTVAPSTFINGGNTQQILQVLGKTLSGSVKQNEPIQSTTKAPSPPTLQALLQLTSIKNEQQVQRVVGKVGSKRQRSSDTVNQVQNRTLDDVNIPQVGLTDQKPVFTQQPRGNTSVPSPKGADTTQQVPQIIIAPQLVYSSGGTTTTIPVTMATVAPGTSIPPAPVATSTALPIIIDSGSLEKPDKIPIKRVRQASTPPDHDSKQKGGGRSNHNEVEKRYRNKINSSLNRLSSLVMGSGKKGTKSNILERAIDKINELKKINKRLQTENNKLRMSLKNLTLQDIIAMTYNTPEETNTAKRSRKGSYSSGESLSDDPGLVDGEELPSYDEQDSNDIQMSPGESSGSESLDSTGSFGMQDRTRVGVSVFLLAFMFFSPLQLFFKFSSESQASGPHFGGRTLLSVDSSWDIPSLQGNYSSIVVHLILVFLIYLWILLKGEPGMPVHSKQRKYCSRLIVEARAHVAQRKFPLAQVKLEECVFLMGRGCPRSLLDLVCGFLWNLCSFIMIQSGIMGAFKAIGWRILPGRKSSAQNKEEVEFSCSLAAQAYLLLHEMAWIDPNNDVGRVTRTYLWLKAINMAEMAGAQCSQKLYIKVYGNAAIDVAFTWRFIRPIILRYMIGQALKRHRVAPSDAAPHLMFLFHPQTGGLLLDRKLALIPAKKAGGITKDICLTEAVAKQYLLHQVKKILTLFVSRKSPKSNWFDMMKMEMSVVDQCFPLSSEKAARPNCSQLFHSFTHWWQSVVSCLYQSSLMSETALLEGIQTIEGLKDGRHLGVRRTVSSTLLLSVGITLRLKQSDRCLGLVEENMRQVENYIKELKLESEGSSNGNKEFTDLEKLCIMVACELLLSARFKLWEENEVDVVSEAELNQAELSLDFLQYFNFPELKQKVKSYSMLLRYLSGCNPLEILRDLQHNHWYIGDNKEPETTARKRLKDSSEARMFLSSSSLLLRHSLAPDEKIRSRIKSLERLAEGKENTSLRRACRRVLSSHAARGT